MKGGPKLLPPATELPPFKAKQPAQRVLEFFQTHLRHLAGQKAGQPFRLAPWQREEIIRPIFGTVRPDGTRQYRTAYVSMPRRGGKSSVAAGIALYLLAADEEPGAYVVSAAANREQARVVFEVASRMVETSPALSALCQVYRHEIVIPATGSRYKVVSRDAPVQHGMNLSGLIVDELHAHRHPDLYRVLTSSMGSRRNPLTFVITTAGTDVHSIGAEVHRYAEQVRDGVIVDPTFYALIYSAPDDADIWDEQVWRACNPALRSGFRSLEEMRATAAQAQAIPAREPSFRQLYLNQWFTTGASRWLPLDAWDACRYPEMDTEPSPRRAFIGLDLSTSIDLTALVILLPRPGGGYDCKAEFWCPEDSIAQRTKTDRVPYALWVKEGYLTATPGNVIDQGFIEQRLHQLMREYEVIQVGVDPWAARGFIAKLQADDIPAVEVAQTMANLSSPSKALEQLVLSRQLHHNGNPILRWCVSNAVADQDSNGNLRPSKKRSHERIDGVSALVTCLARLLVMPATGSVYDERGPMVVTL